MKEIVECLSSSSYPETPVALTWEGDQLAIESITARWRTPAGLWFRVRTTSGPVFELFYDDAAESWRIHPV